MSLYDAYRKSRLLTRCGTIASGALRLRTPDGAVYHFGTTGPTADLDLRDWSALATRSLGQSYAAGLWDSSDLRALTAVIARNPATFRRTRTRWPVSVSAPGARFPGNEFFQLWLDPGMSFSSALFEPGQSDLHHAQQLKYDRVLDQLAPGARLLDIGCGWGALAERAADRGMNVTGLTRSPGQKGYADARLDGRAQIHHSHYPTQADSYDNIVSIEFLNTLAPRMWPGFLAALKARLAEGGRVVLQIITGSEPGLPTDTMLQKLSTKAGLRITNRFAFGDSYARTCAMWHDQLTRQTARARHMGFDTSFQRQWRFALATAAAGFAAGRLDVVQLTLAHQQSNAS